MAKKRKVKVNNKSNGKGEILNKDPYGSEKNQVEQGSIR